MEKEQEPPQRTRRLRAVQREVASLRQQKARLQARCRCLTAARQRLSPPSASSFEGSLLYRLTQEINSSLDPDDLTRRIVDSAGELLGCSRCSLMLWDESKETLRIHYARGMDSEVSRQTTVRRGEGIAGWVAQHGQPLLIEDIETDARFGRKNRRPYRSPSLLSVPLQVRGETLGVLNVSNKDDRTPFTAPEQDLLMLLAGQAAIALENARLFRELEQLAITDGLTGLYVRDHFQELLARELQRAQRYRRCLSVLMIDIDHFKAVNDTYGHPQGDKVLQELAGLLRRYGRRDNVIARYGGEEFVVALVETDKNAAVQAAERFRGLVERHPFSSPGPGLRLTISIGVASYPRDAQHPGELIACADRALYAAKRQGRNRVCSGVRKGAEGQEKEGVPQVPGGGGHLFEDTVKVKEL